MSQPQYLSYSEYCKKYKNDKSISKEEKTMMLSDILYRACQYAQIQDVEDVKQIFKEGFDVNYKDDRYQKSYLYTAVYSADWCRQHIKIVKILVQNGSDLEFYDHGNLWDAIERYHQTCMVELLLEVGADIKFLRYGSYSGLYQAARNNNIELVKLFLQAEANPEI